MSGPEPVSAVVPASLTCTFPAVTPNVACPHAAAPVEVPASDTPTGVTMFWL